MTLRETIADDAALVLSLGGLAIGFAFGVITLRTNFCTMGSISDALTFGDYRRLRAWLLAAATAMLGAQALDLAGVASLSKSIYLTPTFNWLGHLLGGLMFGIGMVFAGGCPSRNLARVGGGDLRALMTLMVLGIVAFMAMGGVMGPLRALLESTTALSLAGLVAPTQGLPDLMRAFWKWEPLTTRLAVTAAVVGAIGAYCFGDRAFRRSKAHIGSGLGVGLCVAAGWALTGLAHDELANRPLAPVSLTFVRPLGDTLDWLQRFTALGLPGFGVATVLGAILGAHVAARVMGRFRITTFSDANDTLRGLGGATLMGVGGVLALGCTIGQGITGLSTLALGSFLTLGAIIVGGVLGLRALERSLMAAA